MDRFEEVCDSGIEVVLIHLHSSMDRFEAVSPNITSFVINSFTFQYG